MWQPIETAPKDGTKIDIWCEFKHIPAQRVADVQWCNHECWGLFDSYAGEWIKFGVTDGSRVTHWMPLPEPPK